MSKHTPGPWSIDFRGGFKKKAIISGSNWGGLARVQVKTCMAADPKKIYSDDPTGIANAKLIAAAPELLEVLEWMQIKGGLGIDVHAKIKKVIKKATE